MPHGPRLAPGPTRPPGRLVRDRHHRRPPDRPGAPPPRGPAAVSPAGPAVRRRGRRRSRATSAATTAAADEVHVRTLAAGLQRVSRHIGDRRDVEHVRLGIPCRTLPERRTLRRGNLQRASQPVGARHDRRRVERTDLVVLDHRASFGIQLGREIDEIRLRHPLAIVRRWFGRVRLRR